MFLGIECQFKGEKQGRKDLVSINQIGTKLAVRSCRNSLVCVLLLALGVSKIEIVGLPT